MTNKRVFNVLEFKAMPGSVAVQTKAFQAALDACHDAGGGEVLVPTGEYTIGSIRLYSHTDLHLMAGVVLRGASELSEYETFGEEPDIRYLHEEEYVQKWHLPPYYFQGLISAYDCEDVAVTADPGAIIDGQDIVDTNGEEKFRGPMGLVFGRVDGLTLRGYTIQHTANWAHVIAGCTHVTIDGVTILAGHDGFDLHHSTAITVTNCVLRTGDDCFAGYDVSRLNVDGCILNSACNDLRIGGTELEFKRCLFVGPGRYPHRIEGTNDTHAMFKYYAIEADKIKADGTHIIIKDSIMSGSRVWLNYDADNSDGMQKGRPLRDLALTGNIVKDIAHTSHFYGRGEYVKLTIGECSITPPDNEPLLAIDKYVQLTFKDVTLTKPTVIELDGKRIELKGHLDELVIGPDVV